MSGDAGVAKKIWYCKRCSYSQAAHNRVRSQLRDKHCVWIAEQQTAKKLGQDVAIDRLFKQQAARQEGHDIEQDRHLRVAIHEEAYNQALVNLITVHSLPYSLVEWPEWYAVLHTVNRMAPATVTQSRRQVPKLLEASFSSHRQTLACNLAASVTQIHFSIDTWSSPNQHGLLAIVAHFIDDKTRQPCKALLALRELTGTHSGVSLAEIFTEVIDSYGVRDKIGYFTLDNAYNMTPCCALSQTPSASTQLTAGCVVMDISSTWPCRHSCLGRTRMPPTRQCVR